MRILLLVLVAIGVCLPVICRAARLSTSETAPEGHWSRLSQPQYIWPNEGAIYYQFDLPNGSKAHLIVVDTRNHKWTLRPAVNELSTDTTSAIAAANNASAATNGGYFNLKDGESASFVVVDGKVVADPNLNKALLGNPRLRRYIRHILNRSEVRFLENAEGAQKIQIVTHNSPLPDGYKLVDSLQAGPQLLPMVDAVEEAFIRIEPDGKDLDAIGVHKEAARTAFGITADGYAMLLCVSGKGQDPESSGITLDDLASLMRRLGCVQALNLDGGASTTMWVRLNRSQCPPENPPPGTVVCGKTPETLVKSVLLLVPR